MQQRPEWINCVNRGDGRAYCDGRLLSGEWHFVSYEHGKNSLIQKTWVVPCKECMKAAKQKKLETIDDTH